MSDTGIDLCYTIDSIAVGESDQGFAETFSVSAGSSATRRLYCAWADRLTLSTYLLTANTYTVGASIVIYVGATHPNGGKLFVDSVAITPIGNPVGEATWAYAQLDVSYKSLQFDPGSPTVPREDSITLAGELISIPAASVVFADASVATVDPTCYVPYMTYTVSLKSVSALPLTAIATCQNKLHNGTMTIKVGGTTYSIPGDQVVFNGVDGVKISYLPNSAQKFDYSLTFLIAPVNMNKVYNPASMETDVMARYETVVPARYLLADFATLGI